MKTYIRMKELRSVFASDSPSNINAQVARLAVLYEDLRIELYAIAAETISELDRLEDKYRRLYFLRRSIATLLEFSEALIHLNGINEFQTLRGSFGDDYIRRWGEAVEFFKSKNEILKQVRNDTGGHFHFEAAQYSIRNFQPGVVGKIEVRVEGFEKAETKLFFAGEVVATAILRHMKASDTEARSAELIHMATEAYTHATRAVHLLATFYLWDRFG